MSPSWEIKILLTETNPAVISSVEKILADSSFTYLLRRVDDIQDLAFELAFNKPDVIISGTQMNGFDGVQVLKVTHMCSTSIPVLILSSEQERGVNPILFKNGANEIIYHSEMNRLSHEVASLSAHKSPRNLSA